MSSLLMYSFQGCQPDPSDPFRVFASRADIDFEHFGHIIITTDGSEVLLFMQQDIKPLLHFPPDTLFAARWQRGTTSFPGFLRQTTTSISREDVANWMAKISEGAFKGQQVLGRSIHAEDKADTAPSADPKKSESADLQILDDKRGSTNTDADNEPISSTSVLQHVQRSSSLAAAGAAAEDLFPSPVATAEPPTCSPVAAAEVKDDLVNIVFPLLYHVVVKVILLICFLTLCGYLLDWAWSIELSYLQTKFTFEGDFEAHTTFNKAQAEISFVYNILYGVLTAVYFMLWWG